MEVEVLIRIEVLEKQVSSLMQINELLLKLLELDQKLFKSTDERLKTLENSLTPTQIRL